MHPASDEHRGDLERVLKAIENTPAIDRTVAVAREEFQSRAQKVNDALRRSGHKAGFVFSDEHYAGDVPYLGGNTNVSIEQVAGGVVRYLEDLFGREGVVDAQEIYYRTKYEKSDMEMRLIADASAIADAMLRAMLAVLRPGRLESEVAAWGAWTGRMLGSENDGFKIMVGANEANRTLIGQALNRPIREGDWVHLGVAPKRDGLTACVRRSAIAVDSPAKVGEEQRYWFDLVQGGYEVGELWYRKIAAENLPARLQEQALVDYFNARADEVSARVGKRIDLASPKPYTGTHNSGYTECQEFFGAITLDSHQPLARQIVTMLDVALRGIGNYWNDVVIPGFDFCVVENTLGKYGTRVERLTRLPIDVQELVMR